MGDDTAEDQRYCHLAEHPFVHMTMDNVFTSNLLANIKAKFIDLAFWSREIGPLHSFWVPQKLDLSEKHQPELDRQLNIVKHIIERSMNMILLNAKLSVFKLGDGDGIGVHDDADINAVRLVVKIVNPLTGQSGGELVLFGNTVGESIVYNIPENCGVAFSTSIRHVHSVSQVSGVDITYMVVEYPIDSSQ